MSVVAHGVLVLRQDVLYGGGEEVGRGENLEIALGVPAALGAVEDGASLLFPGDLLGQNGSREPGDERRDLPGQ